MSPSDGKRLRTKSTILVLVFVSLKVVLIEGDQQAVCPLRRRLLLFELPLFHLTC
jgi:hypothetical protein